MWEQLIGFSVIVWFFSQFKEAPPQPDDINKDGRDDLTPYQKTVFKAAYGPDPNYKLRNDLVGTVNGNFESVIAWPMDVNESFRNHDSRGYKTGQELQLIWGQKRAPQTYSGPTLDHSLPLVELYSK